MNLEALLQRIDNLPPMPAVAVQLLQATNDPDVDMATIAEWIERDPGMTANLLRLCNSCFYGFSSEVTSVRQAASLFGLRKLAQIALTALSSRYLSGSHPGYALERGELWKHSIVAATAAEAIAIRTGYPNVGTAFTAGLLQDIGKIIIAEFVGDKRDEILALAREDDNGFLTAESRVLGFTHSEAGAMLLSRWNFPAALVEAVRFHHNADLAKADPALASISQLADALTSTVGVGLGADGLYYHLPASVLNRLGIDNEAAIEEILANIANKIADAPDMFSAPKA